jgi:hypothetical protein
MFEKVTSTSDHIFGASDASFKQQSSSHTWIISPGDTIDIENPLLHIAGSGPVDGLPQKLSSGRGELARLTSITIIANLFNHYHSSRLPVKVICDNQSMVKKCNSLPLHCFWQHRDRNFDLFLMQQKIAKTIPISFTWIKRHAEKAPWKSTTDLENQNLSKEQIYNIWCNRMAEQEWENGHSSVPDPGISPDER